MQATADQQTTRANSAGDSQAAPAAIERRPLRIIHVVISMKVGGMEHFIVRIAAAQRSAGHDSSILALQPGALADHARGCGIPVRVLGGRSKHLRVARGLAFFLRERPDIIHAHNLSSLHYAVLGKLVGRPRVVMTNHGQGLGSRRAAHPRELRRTDAVVAVSDAVSGRLDQPEIAGKVRVIHNGIEIEEAARPRREVRAELGVEDRVVGIIVARIDRLKGHECAIRATARLQERGVPFTLLVAGDGVERENYQRLAAELGVREDCLRFLGFRSDIPDLLAASDLFLLPSVTEGLPLSMLEAMSHGLPVVATPVGGIPELIEDTRHGLLVPVGDDKRLADSIHALCADPDRRARLGAAARARVDRDFSFARMTDQYHALYAGLVGA